MACASPVRVRGSLYRCQHCPSCLKAKRALVVGRLLIEALGHDRVSFITLTYAPEHRPADGSIHWPDLRAAMMRLRINYRRALARDPRTSNLPPDVLAQSSRLRAFHAGEYSTRNNHPHFHSVIYGADKGTIINGERFHDLVQRSWGLGRTNVGSNFTDAAALYVASYAAKGMTKKGAAVLEGRAPEGARFPQRPGLGVAGLPVLLRRLLGGLTPDEFIARHGALPSTALLGGKVRSLGRTLTPKLYEAAGFNPNAHRVHAEFQSLKRADEARNARLLGLLDEALATGDLGLEEAVTSILERPAPSIADAAEKVAVADHVRFGRARLPAFQSRRGFVQAA